MRLIVATSSIAWVIVGTSGAGLWRYLQDCAKSRCVGVAEKVVEACQIRAVPGPCHAGTAQPQGPRAHRQDEKT